MRTADTSDWPGDVTAECALQEPGFGAEHTTAIDVDLDLLQIEDLFDRHFRACLPAAFGEPVGLRDVLHVDADHGLAEPARHLGQHVGIVVERGGLDDRRGPRSAGLPDLKMPEPTNTPSAPSCIIIAASAGVAMPPAVNSVTGSLPARATSTTRS